MKPGNYHVLDYVNGKDLGEVRAESGKAPALNTEIQDHLLLEVSAK